MQGSQTIMFLAPPTSHINSPILQRIPPNNPKHPPGSNSSQHPTVNEIGRTNAIARALRAEKHDEICQLRWGRKAPDRRELIGHLLQMPLPIAARILRKLFRGLDPVRC